jgi:hypothetical protein
MTVLPPSGGSEIADRLRASFEGSETLVNSEGIEKLVSLVRLQTSAWALVIATPTCSAFASIRQWERQALVCTLLAAASMA